MHKIGSLCVCRLQKEKCSIVMTVVGNLNRVAHNILLSSLQSDTTLSWLVRSTFVWSSGGEAEQEKELFSVSRNNFHIVVLRLSVTAPWHASSVNIWSKVLNNNISAHGGISTEHYRRSQLQFQFRCRQSPWVFSGACERVKGEQL